MTIPFPDRIPFAKAAMVAVLLSGTLFAEGNSPTICLAVLALVLISTVGFNLVRGFHTPAGAYIFFVVLFTGLLGVGVKAATGEPVLDNVPNADQMLMIYLGGTCGMVLAAWLSTRFAPKRPLLTGRLTQANTGQVVIGCLVVGIGLPFVAYMLSPSIGSIVRQLNITLPLAVLVGVYQRVRATGGESSFTWPVLIAWGYSTLNGLLVYSKEAMFAPSLAWLIAAAAARLRVSTLQVIIGVPLGLFAVAILVPFSQYGRNFRAETAADPMVAVQILEHPLELREKVNQAEAERPDLYHFFNEPRGIFDRLTMLPIDSALVRRTDASAPIGIKNTYAYFENILPHFITPNKPDLHVGNDYAHEIGMLAPTDISTGISFSPYSDAYHQAGWFGVLLIMPAVLLLLFIMMAAVVGTTDEAPWALFFVLAFGHIAAEGLLLEPVYVMSYGMEAIIATAFIMIYVTPLFGTLFLGPGRRGVVFQPAARAHAASPGARRRPVSA